jgi:hypothetical protein
MRGLFCFCKAPHRDHAVIPGPNLFEAFFFLENPEMLRSNMGGINQVATSIEVLLVQADYSLPQSTHNLLMNMLASTAGIGFAMTIKIFKFSNYSIISPRNDFPRYWHIHL